MIARETEGERERARASIDKRERESEQELYYFVIGVVHLDCNQGAPRM